MLLITALIYDICILVGKSFVQGLTFCHSLIRSGLRNIMDDFNYLWATVSQDMKKPEEKEEEMWNSH